MSCKNCEKKPITIYIRVGNGNIEVAGCEKHLRMLINELRPAKSNQERGR